MLPMAQKKKYKTSLGKDYVIGNKKEVGKKWQNFG